LLALATALEQVIEQGLYDKIIVTRSTPEIAESIGFLPGTEVFLIYMCCQKPHKINNHMVHKAT